MIRDLTREGIVITANSHCCSHGGFLLKWIPPTTCSNPNICIGWWGPFHFLFFFFRIQEIMRYLLLVGRSSFVLRFLGHLGIARRTRTQPDDGGFCFSFPSTLSLDIGCIGLVPPYSWVIAAVTEFYSKSYEIGNRQGIDGISSRRWRREQQRKKGRRNVFCFKRKQKKNAPSAGRHCFDTCPSPFGPSSSSLILWKKKKPPRDNDCSSSSD